MKVIKRDGREVPYNRENTESAVFKAANEVTEDEVYAHSISNEVAILTENMLKERFKKPTVEEISDMIEENLMSLGYYDIARAFILYREKQRTKRTGNWLDTELSTSIWKNKYQFNHETLDEFFDRVTGNNEDARKMIIGQYFCPAGRILANRGLHLKGKKVTYSNCYVNPKPVDNIESIFKTAAQLARTFSYGGGSGIDISNLRPKGSIVNNAAITTSGACSFMELYDVTSRIIGQKGRRAALMISMSINHPDVEDFVDIKNDLDAITKANVSIRVTNKFMESVLKGETFQQKFYVGDTEEIIDNEINSVQLFNKIAYSNWRMAEPGFLYWDRIKNWSILSEDDNFEYGGVNPCAEETLPVGGSCLLGSLNLAEFVNNPFEDNAYFNYEKFKKYVSYSVTFLNEILDEGLDLHPLPEQRKSVRNWRQIGLGIMGLADLFIKMGVVYGSAESIVLINKIGKVMVNAALQQSSELSKRDGTYPMYNKTAVLNSPFIKENATAETYRKIVKYGLRNSQLLTIAPTGSISNMFGISGGIEPIFALSYKRITQSLHEDEQEYEIFTPIVKEYMDKFNVKLDELPEYFVTSHDIDYKSRISVQSAWQRFIDASISSTINLPNEATIEDIKDIYMYAWEKGLKGVTVYRAGCAREGILTGNESGSYKELEPDDFVQQGICPNCKADLNRTGGCSECINCGYTACSI